MSCGSPVLAARHCTCMRQVSQSLWTLSPRCQRLPLGSPVLMHPQCPLEEGSFPGRGVQPLPLGPEGTVPGEPGGLAMCWQQAPAAQVPTPLCWAPIPVPSSMSLSTPALRARSTPSQASACPVVSLAGHPSHQPTQLPTHWRRLSSLSARPLPPHSSLGCPQHHQGQPL